MSDTVLLIITAVFSGIAATFVTFIWQGWSAKLAEKRRIFTVLMSKRYDITAEESVEALNAIHVVFYKSKKVRNAWNEFHNATRMPEEPRKTEVIEEKQLQ